MPSFQHLTLTCQSIQGKPITLILELLDPMSFTCATIGHLTLLLQGLSYSISLTITNLNKEVVWDQHYLDTLKSIFRNTHKQYTISCEVRGKGVELQVKSEITKGIKIVLMKGELEAGQGDACSILQKIFDRLFVDKTLERQHLSKDLKKLQEKNDVIEKQIKRLNAAWVDQELKAKKSFIKKINDVKLRIRRKWPDTTRNSIGGEEEKMEEDEEGEDGEPRIRVIEPMEELFNVFK